jgi:folate-binding protein YgfZ
MIPEHASPGILSLVPRSFVSLRGPDTERFLNGQVTNDIRGASESCCIYSAVLNAKGQLDAVCHVRMVHDAYLLDAPGDLGEALVMRLERYLIADEVELSPVTDTWHLTHLVGMHPDELRTGLPDTTRIAAANRLGVDGHDLLSPGPLDLAVPVLTPDQAEALRIDHGVPAWPHELTPGLLPPEAGLDATAISYDKGCYLGQEVISRMKRAGKTNRHLVHFSVPADTPAGSMILADGSPAGTVTSVSPIGREDGQANALGYRSRKSEDTTTFNIATPDGRALPGQATVLKRLAG